MESIRELYKIGNGPSSSHTIGPKRAVEDFLAHYPQANPIVVTLYGSLALTGKGHLTDAIIDQTLQGVAHEIRLDSTTPMPHPNTLCIEGQDAGGLRRVLYESIGGGSIVRQGETLAAKPQLYPHHSLREIKAYCTQEGLDLAQYVMRFEGEDIRLYLQEVMDAMLDAIERGLATEGTLPGKLHIARKAHRMMQAAHSPRTQLFAYAYAVSEENACGHIIVCAPTCGASGVLPSVLRYAIETLYCCRDVLLNGLAVAGLIGNLVKHNASISGAEAGCQAEVGTACAMAAAMYAYLRGMSSDHIEQVAEIALEHHLGLTCDPIGGYVQIPCIERNAVAAMRAVDAYDLAALLNPMDEKITFDMVCFTMLETGKDLTALYRETAQGGLAKLFPNE